MHVVGWSLGGIFALLTAADRPDLPIASVTALGLAVRRPAGAAGGPAAPAAQLQPRAAARSPGCTGPFGGAPQPLVRWAFQLSSFQKLITKPLAIGTHLDDVDFLAQLEAVDRFTANMIAYPGRTFGQLYHRFIRGNALRHRARWSSTAGRSGREHHRAGAGLRRRHRRHRADPVRAGGAWPCSPARAEVRFEIVPGGHLGMLTGRAARGTTWRVLDEWIDQWSAAAADARGAGRKTAPGGQEGGPEEDEVRQEGRRPRRRRPRRPAAKKAAAKKATGARSPRRSRARQPGGDRRQPDPPLLLGGLAVPVPVSLSE